VAITTFDQLMDEARKVGPKMIAMTAPHDPETLLSAQDAQREGIASCTLVGDRERIKKLAAENNVDITHMMIIHEPDRREAARKTMELLRVGHADLAMKGNIETADFLRAALDREFGVRTGRLISHVAVFEVPGFERLLFVSDSGVVVAPTLEQKVDIVQNAILVAQAFGVQEPRVAVLAATEMVNPKIPTTMDAANLAKMAERGQIQGGIVDGPLALDNAISSESAAIKGIKGPVAGHADILIAPDIEAGNMLAKAITYFAKGKMAGVVMGGRSPLVVASRSDPHETKLMSMALGVLLAS
jgi:phosphate butyryltransferase